MTERPPHLLSVKDVVVPDGAASRPMTWAKAHQVAHMAAAKAHHALNVDLGGVSVDVVSALGAAGVIVIWRPMPQLFGAYINETGSVPGVLINYGLPRPARRYTCAHELGHHWMRHSTTVDDGSSIDTALREDIDAVPAANRRRAWPEQEKLAEAFASWFLMPRRVVSNALDVLNLTRPRNAADAYALSLLLGTSYRTTVRHLPNLRLASMVQANSWASVAPGRIKASLDKGVAAPGTRHPDVWVLDKRFSDLRLPVKAGDRVVLTDSTGAASFTSTGRAPLAPLSPLGPTAGALHAGTAYEIGPGAPGDEISLDFPGTRTTLFIHPTPTGLDPRGAA